MKNNFNILKIYCLCLSIFITSLLHANNYYVDPSSIATTNNGSITNPWKTIAQVNSGTTKLLPGDSVLFKRGQSYNGRLIVSSSGSSLMPIVYSGYGVGNNPELTFTTTDVITVTSKQYIVIDGFKIIDKTMSTTDHSITAKISYAIVLNNAPNCTIRNCDISLVGIGIEVTAGSDFTTILNNHIYNLRSVRNTVGGNDDYGATAMVIGTSNNKITNNLFSECWATSYDYGYDGGAIEFYGSTMNENIMAYNTTINCNGFIETGSNNYGIAINNLIAYNKIINCGLVGTFHNKQNGFGIRTYNMKIFNNVIVQTKKILQPVSSLFWYADPTKIDVVILKNNIIWLTTGENVVSNNQDTLKMVHTNNIYTLRFGILGVELDSSELLSNNTKLFVDTTGDPENWDFRLEPKSPAINFGVDVGLTNDYIGNPIVGNPDAGIYEYQDTTKTFRVSYIVNPIKCFGDTTTITISATGGIPPYEGVGVFTASAGIYSQIVSDALGERDTLHVIIEEPTPLQLSLSSGIITTENGTTNIVALADGGTSPYTYQLDNGVIQSSGTFYNVTAGTYSIIAIDKNGCTTVQSIQVFYTPTTTNPGKLSIVVYPNPTSTYFTINPIKYRGNYVTMYLRVYNIIGQLAYSIQGMSNISYKFGANFVPGNYTLIAQVDGTIQAKQLIKL